MRLEGTHLITDQNAYHNSRVAAAEGGGTTVAEGGRGVGLTVLVVVMGLKVKVVYETVAKIFRSGSGHCWKWCVNFLKIQCSLTLGNATRS